ncbi:hypothetical protein [Noviherbaspirillum aridicola]|uniref:Uncharacterized protein n=1 Tax=Noviherbaspirillum aridicola TaxID=2849687 RepID=A0ABQ4Q4N6_9BURK|nr:hypothetical protein [Noviherbaspirillum aridicola]GIZ51760.1 hypothetical protein NCCP691_17740 [Noviherbaspirillum aridicola]
MRSILLAFLLLVFAVQGLTVAVGGNLLAQAAAQDYGHEEGGAADSVQAPVDADIEEMSDYVAAAMAAAQPDRPRTSTPQSAQHPESIDLPRAPPPPRA